MIKKYQQGNKISYDISKYYVDSEAEISQVPMSNMGSEIYVISTGETWIIGSDNTRYPATNPSKDPIACDCVEESTIWGDLPTPEV